MVTGSYRYVHIYWQWRAQGSFNCSSFAVIVMPRFPATSPAPLAHLATQMSQEPRRRDCLTASQAPTKTHKNTHSHTAHCTTLSKSQTITF